MNFSKIFTLILLTSCITYKDTKPKSKKLSNPIKKTGKTVQFSMLTCQTDMLVTIKYGSTGENIIITPGTQSINVDIPDTSKDIYITVLPLKLHKQKKEGIHHLANLKMKKPKNEFVIKEAEEELSWWSKIEKDFTTEHHYHYDTLPKQIIFNNLVGSFIATLDLNCSNK